MTRLSDKQVLDFSLILHKARTQAVAVESLTKTFGDFSLDDAYRIQALGVQDRQRHHEKKIGYKMGLTSKAKMEQMGLHTPIFGVLTDAMQVTSGQCFDLKNKIHPKAEPEIYFITKHELKGSASPREALDACSHAGVALEILDSRYQGFKYFTLPDVVADNSSSAFFVLGTPVAIDSSWSFQNLKIEICENTSVVHAETTNAILGDPILSLCELVKLLGEQNQVLPSGSVVLAGAATAAIPLKPGQKISATLENLGDVSFTTS